MATRSDDDPAVNAGEGVILGHVAVVGDPVGEAVVVVRLPTLIGVAGRACEVLDVEPARLCFGAPLAPDVVLLLPVWRRPRFMQSRMAAQMWSRLASSCSLVCATTSLARFISTMVRPERLPISSISCAVRNGYGTSTEGFSVLLVATLSARSASVCTKPPPIEK